MSGALRTGRKGTVCFYTMHHPARQRQWHDPRLLPVPCEPSVPDILCHPGPTEHGGRTLFGIGQHHPDIAHPDGLLFIPHWRFWKLPVDHLHLHPQPEEPPNPLPKRVLTAGTSPISSFPSSCSSALLLAPNLSLLQAEPPLLCATCAPLRQTLLIISNSTDTRVKHFLHLQHIIRSFLRLKKAELLLLPCYALYSLPVRF